MPESTKEGVTGLSEGSDIGLGPGDRAFEPHYSDQSPSKIVDFRGAFVFFSYTGTEIGRCGGLKLPEIIYPFSSHPHQYGVSSRR